MIRRRPGEASNTPGSAVNMADTGSRRFSKPGPSSSPKEAHSRLAIRELVEAYAHCADRRDAKGQMSLFTANTHFVVYMKAKDPTPSQELHSREPLPPAFAELHNDEA